MLVETAKRDLARRRRRGIGNVIASLFVWILLGVLGLIVQHAEQRAVMYIIAAVLLWPVSAATSMLLGQKSLRKENPIVSLAGLVGALNIIFIPLFVGAYFTASNMLPLYLAVLMGAQFLLYIWIYDSLAYLFGSLGLLEVAVLIALLAPGAVYVAIPFMAAGVLFVTLVFLLGSMADDRQTGNLPESAKVGANRRG